MVRLPEVLREALDYLEGKSLKKANVIQGISIGRWSVIGAGAVVIEDIPAGSTAVGVPAKVIKNKSHG